MILPRFEFTEEKSIKGVCSLLEKNAGKAKVIAGGTDLLVKMKKKIETAEMLISLDKIPQFRRLSYSEKQGLRIGPLTTMTELMESAVVQEKFPALARAASKLGSAQIRSRATIGGNVCSARPAADTLGPLIGYAAKAKLAGRQGVREVALEEFSTGPGKTILSPCEILTEIFLPPPVRDTFCCYIKIGTRKAAEIAIVSVTAVITLSPRSSECTNARVVLGAVAPTFIRCQEAEKLLMGKKITEDVVTQAAALSAQASRPITDLRGSAEYRRMLIEALSKRAILKAVQGGE